MTVAFEHSSPRRDTKRLVGSPLLDLSNQSGVRADLATFFGPNADRYLEAYEGMRLSAGARRVVPSKWSWSAFLLTFVWFFYRKMYAFGATILFAPVVVGYLFGTTGGAAWAAVWVVCTRMSTGMYVNRALDRIAKADQLGLSGAERSDYLRRAGGVSLTAGIFAGVVYALMLAAVVAGVLMRHHVRH